MSGESRTFETGATRSNDTNRPDPEGFLSPIALERFFDYMTKHRRQADGKLRDSDNWQKGMPLTTYIKGMWRHFLHLWQRHRGWTVTDPWAAENIEEDLCAIIFNAQGYLHEIIKHKRSIIVRPRAESAAGDAVEQFIAGEAFGGGMVYSNPKIE